jgi:hypothetical protein
MVSDWTFLAFRKFAWVSGPWKIPVHLLFASMVCFIVVFMSGFFAIVGGPLDGRLGSVESSV